MICQCSYSTYHRVCREYAGNVSTHKQNNYFPPGPLPSSAQWVIRTGMPAGNGGLELASGDSQIKPAATGRSASSGSVTLTEYKIQIDGLPLSLPLGHYWLAVSPNVAFVASQTSGANCVGTPCGNSGSAFVQALATGVNAVMTGLFCASLGLWSQAQLAGSLRCRWLRVEWRSDLPPQLHDTSCLRRSPSCVAEFAHRYSGLAESFQPGGTNRRSVVYGHVMAGVEQAGRSIPSLSQSGA
jgi:hypothetical protein